MNANSPHTKTQRHKEKHELNSLWPLCLCVILLLAASLRFYRLDAQSFWNDEGNAIRAAQRTIPLVIAAARGDIHPPGYYLLLHFWRIPTGDSEFAVRSLSVYIGLLTVALTGRLGRRMLGAGVGAGAAFLAAISPLAVYYSQEARMYGLLGLLAVASTDLLWSLLHRPRPATALLYALVAAAGLYTHYSFPFVLVAHNLLFFGRWITTVGGQPQGLPLRWWVALQALAVFLYLPWLPTALRAMGWPSAGRGYTLGGALLDVFRALTVGLTLEALPARPVLIGAGVLLIPGLWPRPKTALAVATLALWLLVPLVLIFAFDLYKPAYLKFLLTVLPSFCILLAAGVQNLARWLPAPKRLHPFALFTFYVFTFYALLPSLRNLYFNPAYARDDYRGVAADIAALGRPGDGVILNAPNQWEVFTYYYRGDLPLYPAPYHPTPEQVSEWLTPILASHRRLFVLYWGDREADPERRMENLLADGAYPAWSRWYGRVRVALYGLGPLPEEPRVTVRARFGQEILLHGYAVGEGPFVPGDVVPVTLFWETDAPPGRYKVFLHLMDSAGNLVAQNDAEPRGDLSPTFMWSVGERVTDRHGVYLPPDLPPGVYRLMTGMYRVDTGERLPLTLDGEPAGDSLELGEVVIR
jgi:mannosyltransferase